MADLDTMLAEVIDGDADAATLTRVADLVRTDAAVRERFLAQVAIAGALRARHLPATRLADFRLHTLANLVDADDLARTGRTVLDRLPARPAPRARRSWWLPSGIAVAAAALLLTLFIPGTPPAATVRDGADAVLVRHESNVPIVAGMALFNGDQLTSGTQPVNISFVDGSTVDIPPATTVVLERVAAGKRLRLEQGQLYIQAAKQPEGQPLLALTARTTITVVGTRFHLATATGSDFVAVQNGTVTVQRGGDGAQTTVTSGRAVVIAKDQPLTTMPIATLSPQQDIAATRIAPAWNGTGTGLRGDYYADHAFTRLAGTRIDPQLRFDWPGSPIDTVPANHFTVRWTGRIQPRVSGTHTFILRADDGVRLWIDGKLLIDTWHRPDIADQRGEIALEAGRLYSLQLDYFDNTSAGEITLWWQATGQAKEIVPTSQLYPP